MNHGSLFSGGGGFDLAAEAVGWKNVFHCETDSFCQAVLKHYWPNADSHADIRTFNAKPYRGLVDIISGGFPCQPFSIAGKRRGTEDDRYLWPEMLRVIREVRPSWVVGENVYGLINWNDGLVLDTVLSDLEAEGYEVQTYLLPAAGIGAPHQRYRVWVVAYNGDSTKGETQADSYPARHGRHLSNLFSTHSLGRDTRDSQQPDCLHPSQLEKAGANTNCLRSDQLHCKDAQHASEGWKHAQHDIKPLALDTSGWRQWPTEPPVCGGDDGLPLELDGIAISKWKTQSIKLFGNAIVPQLAVQLFKAIKQYQAMHNSQDAKS